MNNTELLESSLREAIERMYSALGPTVAAGETVYKQIVVKNADSSISAKKGEEMFSNKFKEAVREELQRQGKTNANANAYKQLDYLLNFMTEDIVKGWCDEAQLRLAEIKATAKRDEEASKQYRKRIRELEKEMQDLRDSYKDFPAVEMDNQAKIAIAMYKNLTEIAKGIGADGNMAAKEGAYIVWAYLTKIPPSLAIEADRKDPVPQQDVNNSMDTRKGYKRF